jgi:hypothetical protein
MVCHLLPMALNRSAIRRCSILSAFLPIQSLDIKPISGGCRRIDKIPAEVQSGQAPIKLMKSVLALAAALAFLAECAFAGSGSEFLIRQHARGLSDQNNASQGVLAPDQPASPTATATPPAGPSPAVTRLQIDLAAIKPDAPATAAQKQQLAKDLIAVAQGAAKPSQTNADNLANLLAGAFGDKALSSATRARFTQEMDALLNRSKYPQAKPEGIYIDIKLIFQENGLSQAKATAISDSVKTLAAEAR